MTKQPLTIGEANCNRLAAQRRVARAEAAYRAARIAWRFAANGGGSLAEIYAAGKAEDAALAAYQAARAALDAL